MRAVSPPHLSPAQRAARQTSPTLFAPHYRCSLPAVALEIVRGQARHRVRPVQSPVFLIGTSGECDLVLGDPAFSSIHSYLFLTNRQVSARCIGTGPMLSIGGKQLESAQLSDGDILTLGSYEFRVRIDWSDVPMPAEDGPREDEDLPKVIPIHNCEASARAVSAKRAASPEASVTQLLAEVRTLMGEIPSREQAKPRFDKAPHWQVSSPVKPASVRRE